jgi:hypothetical protein
MIPSGFRKLGQLSTSTEDMGREDGQFPLEVRSEPKAVISKKSVQDSTAVTDGEVQGISDQWSGRSSRNMEIAP